MPSLDDTIIKNNRSMTVSELSDYVEQLFAASFADENTMTYEVHTFENAILVVLSWDNASETVKQCRQGNSRYLEIWNDRTGAIRNVASMVGKKAETAGLNEIIAVILLYDGSDINNEKILYGIISDSSNEYDAAKVRI